MAIETTANNKLMKTGSGRVFPGIWDLTKNTHTCGIRVPGKRDSPKFGTGWGIGKETDIRDSGGRRLGRGSLVKKGWECGISTLPIFKPYEGRVGEDEA